MSWSARTSRCTGPSSRREWSCCTVNCPRSGLRSSTNGFALFVFRIVIRKSPAAHTDATCHPSPPRWGFVVFVGDLNGEAEYDLDVVRDRKSSYVVVISGLLRNAIPILAKSDRAQLISISNGDDGRPFQRKSYSDIYSSNRHLPF